MVSRRSLCVGATALVSTLPAFAATVLPTSIARAEKPIRVAAATDLQVVLPKLAEVYARAGGAPLSMSFGSTGNLARQIRQGAPFELILAADESFIEALAGDGVLADRGAAYARGRLALVAGRNSVFASNLSLARLIEAGKVGQPFRMAIANPEHAPYGRRAMEALTSQGGADVLKSRLVYGETVAQALQFVLTGAAAVGLVGSSLVSGGTQSEQVVAVVLPEAWHTPIIQRLAVTPKGGDAARKFADFMIGADARAILMAHGFALP